MWENLTGMYQLWPLLGCFRQVKMMKLNICLKFSPRVNFIAQEIG